MQTALFVINVTVSFMYNCYSINHGTMNRYWDATCENAIYCGQICSKFVCIGVLCIKGGYFKKYHKVLLFNNLLKASRYFNGNSFNSSFISYEKLHHAQI